jgi:hypothetical protein
MGDDVEFVTTERTAMNMVGTHGSEFETSWQSGKNAISAGEAGIGSGRLGAAFASHYRGAEAELKQAADEVPALCQHCADAGRLSADDTEDMDQTMARRFDLL